MTRTDAILRLVEAKFHDGLVPCAPSFIDVVELPGEAWRGKWRVTAWGSGEIATDVDVDATGEVVALEKALATFEARTIDEWRNELPGSLEPH